MTVGSGSVDADRRQFRDGLILGLSPQVLILLMMVYGLLTTSGSDRKFVGIVLLFDYFVVPALGIGGLIGLLFRTKRPYGAGLLLGTVGGALVPIIVYLIATSGM